MKGTTNDTSQPIPIEWLCDAANWSFVSGALEVGSFMPGSGSDDYALAESLYIAVTHWQYKYMISPQVPLIALVAPSMLKALGDFQERMRLFGLSLHSTGVERGCAAIINPESFRYFERDGGWTAKFTLPHAGVLLTENNDERNRG